MFTRLLLAIISLYQRWISPLLGDCCRFEPSCSRYAQLCLRHHGAGRGSWLALRRIARCNPFCAGGIDLPPLPSGAPALHTQVDWARLSRRIEHQSGPTRSVPHSLSVPNEPTATAPRRNGASRP